MAADLLDWKRITPTSEEIDPDVVHLPANPLLWSYYALGRWLTLGLGFPTWLRQLVETIELDGANLDELLKTENGFAQLLTKAAKHEPFYIEKALSRAELTFPQPPDSLWQALASRLGVGEHALAPSLEGRCLQLEQYIKESWARVCKEGAVIVSEALSDTSDFDPTTTTTRTTTPTEIGERIQAMLWLIFVGDALGMPAQWFYRPGEIGKVFGGPITGYLDAPDSNPCNTVMAAFWENNREGCREVVGKSILFGKDSLWPRRFVHYHHGMKKGQNTLTALLAWQLLDDLDARAFDAQRWAARYVEFMTTPGKHDDTFAETYHVQFFVNLARHDHADDDDDDGGKRDPLTCAGKEGHSMASVGALVALPVLVASRLRADPADLPLNAAEDRRARLRCEAVELCKRFLALTHTSPRLLVVVELFCWLLLELLAGRALRPAIERVGRVLGVDYARLEQMQLPDAAVVGRIFGLTCYVHTAFPAALYMAYKYQDRVREALLANVNCGGNTTHRSSLIGIIQGAAFGLRSVPAEWIQGLVLNPIVEPLIVSFAHK